MRAEKNWQENAWVPGGEKGVYIQVWAPLSSPAWGQRVAIG